MHTKKTGVRQRFPVDDALRAVLTDREAEGGNAQLFLGHEDRRTTRTYLRGKNVRVVQHLKRLGTGNAGT